MTDEAAQVDENMPPLDEIKQEEIQTPEAEPAPATDDNPVAEQEAEKPNKVQERINKITRDKYEQKRRAEEAEAELEKLRAAQAKPEPVTPKLEDFDYDETKFGIAMAEYVAKKATQEEISNFEATQKAREQQTKQQEIDTQFNAKVSTFMAETDDYAESIANLPELPTDTLNAIMMQENGPQLAYYLSKHLDVADTIANSPPIQAALELGRISHQLLTTKPIKQPSAAPEPIEPVSSGGKLNKELEDMSMDEIYAME